MEWNMILSTVCQRSQINFIKTLKICFTFQVCYILKDVHNILCAYMPACCHLSHIQLFATLWTVIRLAPLSMGIL